MASKAKRIIDMIGHVGGAKRNIRDAHIAGEVAGYTMDDPTFTVRFPGDIEINVPVPRALTREEFISIVSDRARVRLIIELPEGE